MYGEHATLETRFGEPLFFRGIDLHGRLRGLLFEMTVEQHFENPGEKSVEIVYTFPLPWRAILLDVDVTLGSRHLRGEVVAKAEAESRYEEAIADGDAALMIERLRDGTYTLNLGNLAPGEACVIRFAYAQVLRFEQGTVRLMVPTVIAPRYGEALIDGGLMPHQVPETGLRSEYRFDASLEISGALAGSRIDSPSHEITVTRHENGADVHLTQDSALDRDFVLVLDQLQQDSVAVTAPDPFVPEQHVMLASMQPTIDRAERGAVSVKMLIDCSGSMNGDSIAAARRALAAIVERLEDGDRFSLSRFGSTVEHRSPGLWKVTDSTRLAAQRWIGSLEANLGGTEMESALISTFALGSDDTSDVLIVTDGQIYSIDSVLRAARTSGQRIFVVGIGSSPAEGLLRRLAEDTGGASDFVAPGEAVESTTVRMFSRLRGPQWTEVTLSWRQMNIAPRLATPLRRVSR